MASRKVDIKRLARIIVQNLKAEFAIKHLSKNLINTISVVQMDDKIQISIPAQTYNMLEYFRHKVVVHNGRGSYASKLDINGSSFFVYPGETRKGSFRVNAGNHKGYINKVINASIEQWLNEIKPMSIRREG